MQAPSATKVVNEVRDATLKYLWRQWRAVGATVTGSGQANAIVDPEVLILASLWMMDFERRLVDVTTSWVSINSSLLSIQRLGNLRDQFPKPVAERLAALAVVGIEAAKDQRWQSLRRREAADLGARGDKVRAVEVRFSSWATLLLQLRRGMGVGAKADVLAFLLGTNETQAEWASVATIADAICYTPAAVRRVADDLAAAKFIRVPGTTATEHDLQRMYSGDPAAWAQLLRVARHHTGWGYWRERLLFIIDLLTWIRSLSEREVTAYAGDVEARELLTRHSAALLRDRVIDPIEYAGAELDLAYLEKAAVTLTNWMENQG